MSAQPDQDYEDMMNWDANEIALEDIDVSQPDIYKADIMWPFFDRLRKEAPVHYCKASENGPYWSVTKYKDIMEVEANAEVYSSEPTIGLRDPFDDLDVTMFIAMDEPKHGDQRKTVQGIVAPNSLATMEPIIRTRIGEILDSLPVNETFNWVDKVSIELTTQMLATLFDFPFEDRANLTYWSDVATTAPGPGALVETREEQTTVLLECLASFTGLWNERVNAPPTGDLISMLAHGESTRNMQPMEFLGNLMLLIVGGNDTTRNSLTGGVLALNEFPAEYDKLRANPELIPKMVPEIIRCQTPVVSMRRTATQDTILGGKQIRKGDKVVMWYVSGNRDEEAIENADQFIIDRNKPRQHLSFGFGIHRCMGNRLAEMQIRVAWEEILKRFEKVELVGKPVRSYSSLISGFTDVPVQLRPLK